MTDTGQIPGEGLPENAGMVEQPGVPAPGAYTYLSETTAEDEDLLLLPGAQSAWGNEVAPPAPEPVVETVHQPGPHEMSGRDSGSVDLGGVRLPEPEAAPEPASAPVPPRRPLHLGPPIPDTSASPVRSLADRGPADAPVRHAGPPTAGPEYLDVQQAAAMPPQGAAPWGAQSPVSDGAAHAETVVPVPEQAPEPVGAAQALVTRVATEAVAATGGATGEAEVGEAEVGEVGGTGEVGGAGGSDETGEVGGAGGSDETGEVGEPGEVGMSGAVGEAEIPAVAAAADVDAAAEARTETVADGAEGADGSVGPVGADAVPGDEATSDPETPNAAGESLAAAAVVPEAAAEEASAPQAEVEQAAEPDPGPGPGPGPVEEAVPAPEAVTPEPAPEPVQAVEPVQPAQEVFEQPVSEDPQSAEATEAPAPERIQPAEPAEAPEPQEPSLTEAPEIQAPDAITPSDHAEAEPSPEAPVPATAVQPMQEQEQAQEQQAQAPAHPQPDAQPEPDAQPAPQDTGPQPDVQPAAEVQPVPDEPQPAQGPQSLVNVAVPQAADVPHSVPEPVESDATPTGTVEAEPAPEPEAQAEPEPEAQAEPEPEAQPETDAQPVGQFVPVDGGQVPTTPHLAPTPPESVLLPPEAHADAQAPDPVAPVPAPREADPEVAQSADDLDTRAADQEEPHDAYPAAVAEVRQSAGPAAPAYDDVEREAVLKVMRERRDIRNGFRSDPIPHEVLLRVLEAAHTAPSVGHSQPWDFVVIRSADTRRAMHELAMRQREAYAKSLPKGRAKQFKELKIEAILDTPVNIVVTADGTRGGRHTLGRHTQPQMAPYSSALAVENLWLAARAEGLGVGWVSFFDEREMVRALGLPEHLDVVAYLCVGYVDEFPDEPELMQAGWSKRRPLSWVVHEETYGRRALPGEDPHDLLAETVAQIRPLDAKALGEAWERQKRMTKPAGALGMLEIISAQLSGLSRQCPPPIPEPAAVAVFAGDHGVHAQGVTPWPQEVTAQMVANFLGGGAVCNAFATQVGAEVCVVDVGVATDLPATPGLLPRKVRAGTSDMTTGPAMSREEAKQAIEVGIETARDLVAAGNKALLTGEMGIANTTASAALISVFTGADPADVTGRGTGINDETLARKTEVVRRALDVHQPDPADPIGVLAAVGGFEHAAMVGLLLGGASLRTPVILDGVSAGAAALVARAIAPEVLAACIAGHRSAEPGHVAALNKLGLRPLVDLDLRLGEGTGALLALPMVQSTARAMHEVATFDSAGVTEK
ncbi:nicotinate-nucleotide--dimethylbenzimidazole phosphoribosyltransferase [Streptomyces sp. BB1-1-1]|uniref:nicotinate-nucleotide--dimethylbenzimidazole phosphoribosyltransferase n=1 Tax=Streptomyces sp. BB1-1-1 TaxID=3074430 RepID=UPI0028777836|nr:nicotinate-nucleotide--dimethylbenzimidazole phosphoribosyltransferase [Streptomyces sp. BB1-1-1]WND38580.1 nicotinate-nucleotide--dimethylbenzimidazole phosphoribosyltransferase [Streptomyces sp. BB1-1-1]